MMPKLPATQRHNRKTALSLEDNLESEGWGYLHCAMNSNKKPSTGVKSRNP
jgi:hypothetical protein